MNLPDALNPISSAGMVDAFVENSERVNRDADVRVVIITGAGRGFSSGGNVKEMADGEGLFGHATVRQRPAYLNGIQRIPVALDRCEVPLIAAVNGPAAGAGCDLAMMCDIRISSTKAVFAESFVKMGLIAGDGGAYFLPRVVGPARAAEMTLTGDRVDAETALAWGIVSQVVEPDELLPAAFALAQRIAVNPPTAVRMNKKLLREAKGLTLQSTLELSAAMQAVAHSTKDHHEAARAFVEKRSPEFVGE